MSLRIVADDGTEYELVLRRVDSEERPPPKGGEDEIPPEEIPEPEYPGGEEPPPAEEEPPDHEPRLWSPSSATLWCTKDLSGMKNVAIQQTASGRLTKVAGAPKMMDDGVPGVGPLGSATYKFIHRKGDYVAGGPRVEWKLDNGFLTPGNEFWCGWRYYLPKDFPPINNWLVTGQWHPSTPVNPVIAHELQNGYTRVAIRSGSTKNIKTKFYTLLKELPRGRAVTLKFHIIPAKDSSGLVEVWVDGRKLVSHRGPNQYGDMKGDGDFKLGRYGPDQERESVMWIGAPVFSRTEDDVDAYLSATQWV